MSVTTRIQQTQLVLRNSTGRVAIAIQDVNGDPVAATALVLRVYDSSENLMLMDDFVNGYGDPATPPTHIVNPSLGSYYFPFGDTSFDVNNTTAVAGKYIFHWQVTGTVGTEQVDEIQVVRVVSASTLSRLASLKLRVDKASKDVDDNPSDPLFLGYTDWMLVDYLEGGLGWINAFQPYPMWDSIDTFPTAHDRILLDAAVMDALTSQEIFAIDTDINYCFVEGTPVTLPDGTTRPVESFVKGEEVLDKNGERQQLEAAWDDGVPDELVEIVLWGGRKFVATKAHEWPVWSWPRNCMCGCGGAVNQGKAFALGHHARMKEPYTLKHVRGSTTCTTTSQSIPEGYNPIKRLASEELVAGDFLMVPRTWSPVETDVTVDEALMLGYYAAEGHPLFRGADPTQDYRNLCWTFAKDEAGTWVEDIKKFGAAHDFDVTVREDKSASAIYVSTRNDYGRAVEVIRLAQLAQKHVGSGSLTKRLSEELMQWPREQKLAFITGLLRGDGHQSWSITRRDGYSGNSFGVWYSTSSPHLANQVHLLLAQLGYPTALIEEPAGACAFKGKTYEKAQSFKLKVPAGFAHDLADIIWGEASISRQHDHQGRPGWAPPRPECMVDDQYIYVPIKSVQVVKNVERKHVFNLTVSEDHSYLVQNVATFNSDQGNVFVIDHQPKLASVLNTTWTRLTQMVPLMKRHYLMNGAVRVEAGPNLRFQALLDAAPSGSTFRNWFVS